VRLLRAAGLPVGPERSLVALDAAAAVGVEHKEDFRAALAAVLVSREEQQTIFDQAFEVFWRDPKLLEKMMASLLPKVQGRAERSPGEDLPARIAQSLVAPPAGGGRDQEMEEISLDAAFTFS